MTKILSAFLLAILLLFGTPRLASASDTDTIDTVSSDGETVIMQSGRTYESDDAATSSSWQAGDNVVITNSDKIINTDEGGESVEGTEE